MGRPIKKNFLRVDARSHHGLLKPSHYRRVGDIEKAGDDNTYVLKQKSTNKFIIQDDSDGWTEIMSLVDKNPGSLGEGEFRIDGYDDTGTVYNVVKLFNNSVILGDGTGSVYKASWDYHDGYTNLYITGVILNLNDPVKITLNNTNPLTTGDVITIMDVVGTTELNNNQYTITVINRNTISLNDTDSANFSSYVSGGRIVGVGNSTTIDLHNLDESFGEWAE